MVGDGGRWRAMGTHGDEIGGRGDLIPRPFRPTVPGLPQAMDAQTSTRGNYLVPVFALHLYFDVPSLSEGPQLTPISIMRCI